MLNESEIEMKKLNVVELIEFYNDELNLDDFENGSGVYGIRIGSRGEIESVEKIDNFKLRSKEELIEDIKCGIGEEELKYLEEFVDSGKMECDIGDSLFESLGEEDYIVYYDVVV